MKSWFSLRQLTTNQRARTARSTSRGARRSAYQRRFRRAIVEQLEGRSLLAVLMSSPLDTTIEGLGYDDDALNNGGQASVPPDPSGAAGPTHVVNTTNTSIQWFTKAGVEQAQMSLNNFYRPLNPYQFLFDPKVVYDQYANRFVVVTLEVLDEGNGDPVNSSRVLVAVSDDSDPNGTWHFQAFNTLMNINGEPQWLDYPGLAVDSKAIYLTGNMFIFTNGAAADGGSRLLIIDKGLGAGGLYDGGRSSVNIYNPAGTSAATAGFTLQPAQVFGTTPTLGNSSSYVGTWLVAYNGQGGTTETMMVIRVDSPLTNPIFTTQILSLGDIENSSNVGYPNVTAPDTLDAPQRGTSTLIETNDRRALNAVWRNNALWAVFQVVPNSGPDVGQTTVHWVKIDTTNVGQPVLADQGNIGADDVGGTIYTFMPSIAVDKAGNVVVGFAASGPAIYGSAMYATRLATDPPGTFRTPRTLASGQDVYVRTFGGTDNRWGDYSATVLDPSDETTFWIYNEYAGPQDAAAVPDSGRWKTRWGSTHMGELPSVTPTPEAEVAYVTGVKWSDDDKDGIRDSTEKGVAGFTIYVDVNGNNQIDVGEPAAITAADGTYTIKSDVFGTYAIREVSLPGWTQIYPGASASYEHLVTLAVNQTVSNINFGNNGVTFDFGDAPAPYPTQLAQNGARHAVRTGLHLGPPTIGAVGSAAGVEPDVEADGQPDPLAQGDDLNGVDDEDGVVFAPNSLIAGKTASIPVIVSTGGLSPAALQAWIDFNGDGDWNDPGEQVVKDKVLSQGTYNITFAVPADSTRQPTYARFRYGYERGLGPTGLSIAGEVEDYRVQILTDEPQANDDTATVNQNSINNAIAVLANDFPSSSGALQIDSVSSPTPNGGTVTIGDNGTPANKSDDVVLYSPLNGFTGTDTFTYLVSDGTGKTDTATVTVTVVSILNDPIAVDDSFSIPANGSGQVSSATLDVLANDVKGNKPPILISSVTQPSTGQGTVSITSGGTRLLYTPPSATFVGDLQFKYTISDATTPTPKTSTGTVTLHVGNSSADDIVQYRLQPYDLNGNPISVINPGQEFEMRVFVKDLRTDDTVNNPTDHLGVYAAYTDLLYSANLVSIAGPVEFNGDVTDPTKPWTAGQSYSTLTPGNLDESGAFEGQSPLFTQNFLLLYKVRMRANAVGEAQFSADPADILPLHDTLVYEPPTPSVDFTKITYGVTSLFIGDPADVLFAAVDDTLNASATTATSLPVMLNDLQGLDTPVVIQSTSPIGAFQGTLQISGQNVVYTPPNGFQGGTQQFTYTLRNAKGLTDTATVTLEIGPNVNADDTVQIRLAATDANGNPLTSVNVGDTFQVRAFVKDLRSDDGDGNPNTDRRGVYAAYFDLLYKFSVASVLPSGTNSLGFDITFSNNYTNGKSGDAQIPGVIDESGSFQTGSNPLGASEQLLYVTTFTAKAAGTFTFQPDPADEAVIHDVLTFQPAAAVGVANLRLTGGSLTVNAAGGEGEFTNPRNPLDVNNDGFVSAIDALLVINDMNTNGSRSLAGGGEGETGTPHNYIDVNGDKFVSAIDALMVINYLNGGAGEGEAAADVAGPPTTNDQTSSADATDSVLTALFDETGADNGDVVTASNDTSNTDDAGPRIVPIYYSLQTETKQSPESLRRRREGNSDLSDELAANRWIVSQ